MRRQVSLALDDEHRANLALLGQVERAFAQASRPGAVRGAEAAKLATTLAGHLEHALVRHFDFEERSLFPLLEEAGEGDIVGLLNEEHEAIRAVAGEALPLLRAAATYALDDSGWMALNRCVQELVERLEAHIQKETLALLPLLEDVIDEAADRELAFDYAAN
jgi:hemerythrin-like domain-containing protein